jgi:hypothetical protein
LIKTTLLNLMRVSGAFDLTRIAHRRQSLILTYHRFSTMDKEDFTMAHAFSEQLEYLTSHYHLVSLGQMAECLNSPDSMPLRLAAITIDDGYRDSYDIAFPLLKRCNVPATVFLVTEFADRRAWLWTDKPRYICTYASRQQKAVKIGGRELMIELD